jgi:hypothetical protein
MEMEEWVQEARRDVASGRMMSDPYLKQRMKTNPARSKNDLATGE